MSTVSVGEQKGVSNNRSILHSLRRRGLVENIPMPNEYAGAHGTAKDRFVKHAFVVTRVLLSNVGL